MWQQISSERENCSLCFLLELSLSRKEYAMPWYGFRSASSNCLFHVLMDGNGAGWGRRMGSSSPPCIILFCSILTLSRMTGNTFSPHPCLLGPHETPSYLVKLYFLLICPTTSTIFLMKPISLIKIYLKLQLNLSHKIKSIFRKNWIIYPSVYQDNH